MAHLTTSTTSTTSTSTTWMLDSPYFLDVELLGRTPLLVGRSRIARLDDEHLDASAFARSFVVASIQRIARIDDRFDDRTARGIVRIHLDEEFGVSARTQTVSRCSRPQVDVSAVGVLIHTRTGPWFDLAVALNGDRFDPRTVRRSAARLRRHPSLEGYANGFR